MSQQHDVKTLVKQSSPLLIIVVVIAAIPALWAFFFPDIVLPPEIVDTAKVGESESAPPTVRRSDTETSNWIDMQPELLDLTLVLDSIDGIAAEFEEPLSPEEDQQAPVENDIDSEGVYLQERIAATEEYINEMIMLQLGETEDDQDIINTAEYQHDLAEEEHAINRLMEVEDMETHIDPEEIQQFELEVERINAANYQASD